MGRHRRRQRQWYERETPGRDPRLWLYGPVPMGFWHDRENRHRYLDWLGEQLGYTQPEDWYQVSAQEFKRRRGSRLLHEYPSLFALLQDYRPDYPWVEWRCTKVPRGFWDELANRHRYLDWLGQQLGFQHPEAWYQLSGAHLTQRYGGTLLKRAGGSIVVLVKDYLPQVDWKEWLFATTPQRFWHERANRRRYLDWLGQQLGYQSLEHWYQITYDDFVRWHGSRLLTLFHDSRLAILQEYAPAYPWQEWRFTQVPDGFWQRRSNRRRYLDWLGTQLGFTQPEHWYQLSERALQQHHGSRLLKLFRNSPSAVVKDYLPRQRWLEWRFVHAPNKFWEAPANRRRYVTWLGQQLGFRRPDDWYQLSERHLREWHGARLLKHFGGSPSAIVKAMLPRHRWDDWRFGSAPKGFWETAANRCRYLDWLGTQLGFRRPMDWYALTGSDLIGHGGGRLLNVYGGSVHAIVKDYLPQEDRKEWLFASTPQRFWHDQKNQRRYLQWVGEQVGLRHPEEWYTLSTQQVRAHHGAGLLQVIGNSRLAVLRAYLPDYNWQEWRLPLPLPGFWDDPTNRRRYLEWLGTQLGYQQAKDWQRLRVTDLQQHHGERLLTLFHRDVPAIVDEYLHGGPGDQRHRCGSETEI